MRLHGINTAHTMRNGRIRCRSTTFVVGTRCLRVQPNEVFELCPAAKSLSGMRRSGVVNRTIIVASTARVITVLSLVTSENTETLQNCDPIQPSGVVRFYLKPYDQSPSPPPAADFYSAAVIITLPHHDNHQGSLKDPRKEVPEHSFTPKSVEIGNGKLLLKKQNWSYPFCTLLSSLPSSGINVVRHPLTPFSWRSFSYAGRFCVTRPRRFCEAHHMVGPNIQHHLTPF